MELDATSSMPIPRWKQRIRTKQTAEAVKKRMKEKSLQECR